jgi:hypothetical protein
MAERYVYRSKMFRHEMLRHHPEPPDPTDKFGGLPQGGKREQQPRLPGERLSDQRRDELLAGVFNSEAKMIVLGGMALDPRFQTSGELDQMIRSMQRGYDGWPISTGTPHKYCSVSFSDIAVVVADEIRNDRTTLAYKPTNAGIDALPAIGYLLEYSERHPDASVQKIFSMTVTSAGAGTYNSAEEQEEANDPKKRAPKTRFRILKTILAADGPLREIDVREKLETKFELTKHLENLHNAGIITYRAPRTGEGDWVRFTPTQQAIEDPSAIPANSDAPTLDMRITLAVSQLEGEMTTSSVAAKLIELFPDYEDRTKTYVNSRVSMRLNYLSREGYLAKGEATGDKLTDISLTDEQRTRLEDLVTIIDRFQEGEPEFLDEGRAKAVAILTDRERVAKLMKQAQQNSRVSTALSIREWKGRILEVVAEHEGPINSATVVKALGHRIGKTYAQVLLRELSEAGDIRVVDQRQARLYGPVVERPKVEALPEGKEQLEEEVRSTAAALAQYRQGLSLLLAAHGSHEDPSSTEAVEIMSRIQEIRNSPEFQSLSAKNEALRARLDELEEAELAESAEEVRDDQHERPEEPPSSSRPLAISNGTEVRVEVEPTEQDESGAFSLETPEVEPEGRETFRADKPADVQFVDRNGSHTLFDPKREETRPDSDRSDDRDRD